MRRRARHPRLRSSCRWCRRRGTDTGTDRRPDGQIRRAGQRIEIELTEFSITLRASDRCEADDPHIEAPVAIGLHVGSGNSQGRIGAEALVRGRNRDRSDVAYHSSDLDPERQIAASHVIRYYEIDAVVAWPSSCAAAIRDGRRPVADEDLGPAVQVNTWRWVGLVIGDFAESGATEADLVQ